MPEEIDDKEIYRMLFLRERVLSRKAEPDFAYVNKELLRKGVTLSLCWSECCEGAIANGEEPYLYAAFCRHYHA